MSDKYYEEKAIKWVAVTGVSLLMNVIFVVYGALHGNLLCDAILAIGCGYLVARVICVKYFKKKIKKMLER